MRSRIGGTYDYVVVGAGSAGCVVAHRLGASGARVLVLEAGGSDRKLAVRAPAAFPALFQSAADWNFISEPEPGLAGRRLHMPRGRMLGGTSSMNAMMYVRGNRADYDGWASRHGAIGWAYEDVLPFFRRSERNADHADIYHGVDGEMHVGHERRWLSPYQKLLIDSAVAAGIAANLDFNGHSQEGVGRVQGTLKGGRRWSSADAFLRPAMRAGTVDVLTSALVKRVVMTRGRVTGVAYEHRGSESVVHVEREAILSAGAYGSPHLLMLSGIGPADHLKEMGIDPLLDCPDVGEHLQDHPMVVMNWHVRDPRTLDGVGYRDVAQWIVNRSGRCATNGVEAVVHWASEPGLKAPDFQFVFGPGYYWDSGFRRSGSPAVSMFVSYIGPASRGRVTLRSADPADKPRVVNNLLTEPRECDAFLRAIELARTIVRERPMAAQVSEEFNPSATLGSAREMTQWLRAVCEHTYHPACTCRMGGPGVGVVDPQLQIHGVEGLRVADASVMPQVTSGNTNAPVVMIGERCAEFILRPPAAMSFEAPAPATTSIHAG
jgi:choline dehydrogenase